MCLFVCVSVCERERERQTNDVPPNKIGHLLCLIFLSACSFLRSGALYLFVTRSPCGVTEVLVRDQRVGSNVCALTGHKR